MGFYRRRSGLTAACGLLAFGGLVSAAAPAWSAEATDGKTVSIDVAAGDLHAVVSMLERQVNVEASVRDGEKPYKPVYVHLDAASLPKALRTIARSAGAKVTKNEDGVYVFEPETADGGSGGGVSGTPAGPAPAIQSPTTPMAPMDNRPESRFPAGSLHWQSIVLQHAVPSDILKLMKWDQDLVELVPFKPLELPLQRPNVSSFGSNMILPSNLSGYGNNGPSNNNSNGGQYNDYGSNGYQNGGDPSVPLGTGNGGPAGANYANSAHRSADPNSPNQAHQFPFGGGGPLAGGQFGGGGGQFGGGQFGGGGGQFGGGQFGGGQGNPFGGGQGNPFGGGQLGGQQGRGGQQGQTALPDGVNRIFALQSNNSLLIEATVAGYQTVKNLVRILDIAPRQVQIKVEFVTASVVDVDNLGVNFDLVPYPGVELATNQGSSAVVTTAQPTFLQYATGNIVAQLFQTLVRTRGKVVQAPIVTTTNNVQANINVFTQIPFFTSSSIITGGLNNNTVNNNTANFITLNTGLTITPRINSDDSVTMNLAPQITDVTGQPSVGGIPPTITQSITTLRTVRSGDTMVLGGLVRKQETTSTQRIPILSEIPILGGIFRTRNKQINDTELLIFVTPTIIGESNDSETANANGGQSVTVTP